MKLATNFILKHFLYSAVFLTAVIYARIMTNIIGLSVFMGVDQRAVAPRIAFLVKVFFAIC